MTHLQPGVEPVALRAGERRRPGRAARVSPELVGLLRNPADPSLSGHGPGDDDDGDEEGEGKPLFGLAVAVALSAPLWVIVALLVRMVLPR